MKTNKPETTLVQLSPHRYIVKQDTCVPSCHDMGTRTFRLHLSIEGQRDYVPEHRLYKRGKGYNERKR